MNSGASIPTAAVHAPPSPAASTPVILVPMHPARPKFSQELGDLAQQFAQRPARLSDILTTQGRGFDLLLFMKAGVIPLTPTPQEQGG